MSWETTPSNVTITPISVEAIVRDFLERYDRQLVGSKEEAQLVEELKKLN